MMRERMQASMGDREDLRKKIVQKIRDQARLAAVHSGASKHEIKNFLGGVPDHREVTRQDENVRLGQGEKGPQGQDENEHQGQSEEDANGQGSAIEFDMEDDDEQKNAHDDSDDDHRKETGGKKERTLEERQLQRVIDAHEKFLVKMNEITSGLRNI